MRSTVTHDTDPRIRVVKNVVGLSERTRVPLYWLIIIGAACASGVWKARGELAAIHEQMSLFNYRLTQLEGKKP